MHGLKNWCVRKLYLFWLDDSWIEALTEEKSSLAILDNDHQDKQGNQN